MSKWELTWQPTSTRTTTFGDLLSRKNFAIVEDQMYNLSSP